MEFDEQGDERGQHQRFLLEVRGTRSGLIRLKPRSNCYDQHVLHNGFCAHPQLLDKSDELAPKKTGRKITKVFRMGDGRNEALRKHASMYKNRYSIFFTCEYVFYERE